MADKKIAAEIAESKRREHDLQNMLDQAFGAGTTIAKVSVSLDFDYKRKDVQVPTTSESPATEQHSSEIMTGTRPPLASGSDGQRGNMGPATPPTTSGASTYNNEQVTREYPQGTTETVEQPSPGSLLGMNVTVMADSSKLQDQDQQNSLTQIVGDFIGPALKADPTHFQSDVQFVKFDTSGTEAAKKSAAASAMGDKVQQAISILPIFALLIVGFIVVKAISKAAKDQTVLVQALPDGRMIPLSAPLSLGAPGVEGGRDGAGAAGSGGTQEQGSLPALKKAKPEIGEIPDNVNVPLEQIKKMATERPEAVAMLIKSWLLEDRR
jgi:flagellar M-ring protein FliF